MKSILRTINNNSFKELVSRYQVPLVSRENNLIFGQKFWKIGKITTKSNNRKEPFF